MAKGTLQESYIKYKYSNFDIYNSKGLRVGDKVCFKNSSLVAYRPVVFSDGLGHIRVKRTGKILEIYERFAVVQVYVRDKPIYRECFTYDELIYQQ